MSDNTAKEVRLLVGGSTAPDTAPEPVEAEAPRQLTEAEAIEQSHAIERRMLNRAIQVIAQQTDMTPEQVIEKLSVGIGEEYATAVRQATVKDRLYVPPKPSLHL